MPHTNMEPCSTVDLDQLLAANLPEDAFGAFFSGSGGKTDERPQAAGTAAAVQSRKSSGPPVKEELRQRILLRRLKTGLPELKPDIPQTKNYKLTPEEEAKKERRREQNRRAAKKCREKKKFQESGAVRKMRKTERQNQRLREEVDHLQQYESSLKSWLLTHMAVCTIRLPDTPHPPGQPVLQQRHQQQQQQHQEQQQHQQQQQQLQQQQRAAWPENEQPQQPPQQPVIMRQDAWLPQSPLLQQHGEQSLQHLQPQIQQLYLEQQQQFQQTFDPAPPASLLIPPHTVALGYGAEEEQQPMLGSQGFDALCSQLQDHTLYLDSQELNPALGGMVTTQDNTAAVSSTTPPSPAAPQTSHYLSSSISSSPCPPMYAQTSPITTPATSPPSSVLAGHLPSDVHELLQPAPSSQTLVQSRSALPVVSTSGIQDPEDATLDLPGFPFSMRRKRKSVDRCAQTGRGEKGGQAKILKSATYPCMESLPNPAAPFVFNNDDLAKNTSGPATFTLTRDHHLGSVTESGSRTTTSCPNTARSERTSPGPLNTAHIRRISTTVLNSTAHTAERASPAPPSPLCPLLRNLSPCPQRAEGLSAPSPSPSPSPRSPGCFRFSNLTPPPRSSLTPQPPSPSPVASPHSYCSGSHFSGGPQSLPPQSLPPQSRCSQSLPPQSVAGLDAGKGMLVPVSSGLGYAPVVDEGSDDQGNVLENLSDHLASFLSSSPCEDSECLLSSRGINDLLQDGFMSSQDD